MASVETLYLDRLLDPVTRCFTTSVARQIVDLRRSGSASEIGGIGREVYRGPAFSRGVDGV